MTLLKLMYRAAKVYDNRVFAVSAESGEELSFSDLAWQSDAVAAALVERLGVRAGDHVSLLLPNCLEFIPLYFGILRAGAVAAPVNIRLKPPEIAFIVTDSDARAIIVHRRTWAAAQDALRNLPELRRHTIVVGFPEAEVPSGTFSLESFLQNATPPPPAASLKSSDTAAIIYTSGTTGRPKGAMLSHGNILFNIQSTLSGHGLRDSDVHLLIVPLFHVTGLNTIMPTALETGARLVLSTEIDPARLLDIIGRTGCTTFFGVPTTFYWLSNLPRIPIEALQTLRLICYSGAPMAPLTIARLRELFPGVELHNFFGLTETTSVTTILPDSQARIRPESVGLPPPGIELAIVDESENRLPAGSVGELVIRGPSVFQGYYNRPDATAAVMREGWFHTGDLALLDDEGYLFLQGRKKEMIIVAGENVYPIEVENALCAHPAVQEAAVFGREDRALGEVVHAAVVLRSGEEVSERELKGFLNERLASFKLPRSIRIMDALPRNPSGKVVKRELL